MNVFSYNIECFYNKNLYTFILEYITNYNINKINIIIHEIIINILYIS